MAQRRGKIFVVVLLALAATLLGGGILGFRAWLDHRPHSRGVRAIAVSPDGRLVATASDDHTIKLWASDGLSREPATRAVATLFGHKKPVKAITFFDEGRKLASVAHDGRAIVWDVATRRQVFESWRADVEAMAPLPGGRVAVASNGLLLHKLMPEDVARDVFDEFYSVPAPAPADVIAVSSGSVVAVGDRFGQVSLSSIGAGQPPVEWLAHVGNVTALAFSREAPLLISSGGDVEARGAGAKIWDFSGKLVTSLPGSRAELVGVGFARSGDAVTVGRDGVVQTWRVPGGQETSRVVLSAELGRPTCAVVSPDGRWIAVGCARDADQSQHILESGTVVRIDMP